MRLDPSKHDYVIQPDGRVFHVRASSTGAPTMYCVEFQERHHLKRRIDVRTHCRWPAGKQEYDRDAAQRLANRLEEAAARARALAAMSKEESRP